MKTAVSDFFCIWSVYRQTCIKRSPFGQRKKWSFKTDDLL